ncbi:MAG: MotA/TolQ/ExbB proton channel family protein [Bacteroidia bacterium]
METTPETVEQGLSLLDLIIKGGVIMIPIGLLSIISIYVIIERYIFIRNASKIEANFLNNIKDHLSKGDIKAARAYCQRLNNPISRIIEKGIARIGKPIKEIESAMESVASIENTRMEKNMGFLGLTAGIAPMLGFIGTISGIIKIFYNISVSDNISIGLIAGGLYEKMITSGSGLIVGLIAYAGYHWLNSLIDKFNHKVEMAAVEFVDVLES